MITRQRTTADELDSDQGTSMATEDDVKENQRLIESLEKEIQSVELRLQQFRNSKKQTKDVDSQHSTLEAVTEEIQELEQLVKENEILSRLTVSEASFTVLEQDATSSLRQHTLNGEAGGMQFKLQYDVREQLEKGEDGQPNAEVLMLEMDVRDDMVALLSSYLFSVAADVNVRELFQLLSSYGAWVDDRERAINHFSTSFTELVRREDVHDKGCNMNLVITDPKRDLKFRIIWGLKVLPMKTVVPDLQLEVEASEEVLAQDQKGTLNDASEIFQLMLTKFGIESALHMLVKLMDEPT